MKKNSIITAIIIFILISLGFDAYSKDSPNNQQIGIKLDSNSISKIKQVEQSTDTLLNQNRIESAIWIRASEQVNIKLSLEKTDQPVRLVIYNMLAKPIRSKDVEASELLSTQEFTFENTSDLPQGHYFCVLIGTGFRDTEKFTIAR